MRPVILVEDDPDVRMLMRIALGGEPGLEVAGEASGAGEALEVARATAPAVIVLDHSLDGDVTGLQLAPSLRRVAPEAKIILFSAFDLRREVSEEPAVDVFLRKDQILELGGTVRRMLEG